MIREMNKGDMKRIVDIWFAASILAHDFIEYSFWYNKIGKILQELSNSTVYVCIDKNRIIGFLALYKRSRKEGYISELFVDPRFQGKGFGSELLNYTKRLYKSLSIHVYKKNEDAVKFYERHKFHELEQKIEKETGQPKIKMIWP